MQLDGHRTYVPTLRKSHTPDALTHALPWLVAAVGSLASAALVLELWNADLNVPWTLGGSDANSVLLYVKTTLQHAWPLHNKLLGAPYGQDLYDYPLGDPLQIALTKLLGLGSSNPAVVANLFFLLTFPLTALTALWAFRRVGIGTWSAVCCALLYALAPFHFFRGVDHLMIAAYYTVPLAGLLILRQLAGEPLGMRTALILGAIVGAGFTYYVAFALILLAFATLVSLAAARRAAVREGAAALVAIGAIALLAHAPSFLYNLEHGSNAAVAALHEPEQSREFGLDLSHLVLPVEGHRLAPLRNLTGRLDHTTTSQLQEGRSQALGLVAALAFIWLLWRVLSAPFLPGRTPEDPYLQAAGVGALAAIVLGLAGGAAGTIAYTISPLVRSWSRLSIVIAFFALVAVGKLLDRAASSLSVRGVRPLLVGVAVAAVTVLAVAEQTNGEMVPSYGDLAQGWGAEAEVTAAAARSFPKGSFLLELPYTPYPEALYRQAGPSLHTDRLRWTFGAMSGRPADWTASLAGLPAELVVGEAAAAGAAGAWVDSASYQDSGRAMRSTLERLAGAPRVQSPGAVVTVYDLRPLATLLRKRLGPKRFADLRNRALHPVQTLPGSNLSAPKISEAAGGTSRTSFGPHASFQLVNPFTRPRMTDVTVRVSPIGPGNAFTFTFPDGRRKTVQATPSATVTERLTLRPGRSTVRIDAPPAASRFEHQTFSVDGIGVSDPAVVDLLSAARR